MPGFVILSETKNLSVFFACTEIEERFFASLRMTAFFLRPLKPRLTNNIRKIVE